MAVGLYRQLYLEVNCKAMKGDVVFFKKWTESGNTDDEYCPKWREKLLSDRYDWSQWSYL